MDKPPDHTAEQADTCCELGAVLPNLPKIKLNEG